MLVAGEGALALAMVIAATTLARSFLKMTRDKGGIEPTGVLTLELRLPVTVYPDARRVVAFYKELCERFASLPGATSVGGISTLPFSGAGSQQQIQPLDRATAPVRTDVAAVTPDYFRAIGAQLVSGRAIVASDDSTAAPVAVVDDRLARRFWPNEVDVIGKQIGGWGFAALTVVGVIHHVTNYGVAAESRPELFVSYAQRPFARMAVIVRTTGDPTALAASVRGVVDAMDVQLPVYNLRTMRAVVAGTLNTPRLVTSLSSVLAALALAISAVGLYGLLAFTVSQRTREIGVRMALGATPAAIIGMVLLETGRLTAAGIGVGLSMAVGTVLLLKCQLFGVASVDPLTFGVVSAVFVVVATVASSVPALRAFA